MQKYPVLNEQGIFDGIWHLRVRSFYLVLPYGGDLTGSVVGWRISLTTGQSGAGAINGRRAAFSVQAQAFETLHGLLKTSQTN